MKQLLEDDIPGYSSFLEVLQARASDRPDVRVFSFESYSEGSPSQNSLTWGELQRGVLTLGARLQNLGLEGERAVLLYPPGLEFVTAFFGCLAAGVIAVPTHAPRPNRPPERIRAILDDARPSVILTTAALAAERSRWSSVVPELAERTWLASDETGEDPSQNQYPMGALAGGWRDPGLGRETIAFLQYTSGSTAAPRGVTITHGNLLHNSALIQCWFRSNAQSRGVFWLPLHHDMGLIGGVLQTIYCGGASTLFSPQAFLQEPYRWLETIARTGATISGGPNFAYDLCVRKISEEKRAPLDLSTWTVAFNGSEPIQAETLARFVEMFAPRGFRRAAFLPCYGLAEATLMVSGRRELAPPVVLSVETTALEQHRVVPALAAGSGTRTLVGSGQVISGQEVVIIDPATGVRCPAECVGEIWVAGPSVARGYWNQREVSARTFEAALCEPGVAQGTQVGTYLRTGDLGFLRDGELFVTGRLKDLIIIAGRNVYPQDVEATVARSHPLLRTDGGAAVAVELEGEERVVVVHEVERQVRQDRVDEIAGAIRQAVAEEHELDVFAVVLIKAASIPKTSSGKVRRQACRVAFLAGALDLVGSSIRNTPGAAPAPCPPQGEPIPGSLPLPLSRNAGELEAWLTARLAESLGVTPAAIDPRRPFAQLGLGSLRAIGLAGELQERLGRPLSPTLFYEHPTIADLAAFLAGGAGVMAATTSRNASEVLPAGAPIAVIGIGCRFPQADGPEAFWTLLREGRDAIGEVPAGRRAIMEFDESARGGFLERVDGFDADFFGLSPREAAPMDPQQRLLLEVAWEALEDAGQAPERLAGSATGVFVGIATNDYGRLGGGDDQPGEVYGITGNASSIAANRVSYLFDFRGPSLAIDTACSSSLVAVHLACQSLRSGESTLALAGGVNLILSPAIANSFRKAGMLAPDGRCKTFDAQADGYVRSEGAGFVVLKPLARALADGDSLYAVIRGSAINQDGRSNGLTAPSRRSQEAVLRTAYRQAGIAPAQIDYVEAHGSGTYLGDPIELKALGTVLAEGRPAGRHCLVGSVKTNIGHLEAAAGIAGLIKTALGLKHRAIPAHLHFQEPNPQIPFMDLQLEVPHALTPCGGERPVFAGVSSFGFGGTNAHVVLEGVQEAQPEAESRSETEADFATPFLLPVSARRPEALKSLAEAYRDALASGLRGADLRSIAASASGRRGHHDHRLALIGRCRADWIAQLGAFLRDEPHPGLFTSRALGGRNPELAAALEACSLPRDRDGAVIPTPPAGNEERAEWLASLAVLYTTGAPIAWDQLDPSARFVRLPSYRWQRDRFWWETELRGQASPKPRQLQSPAESMTRCDLDALRIAPAEARRARLVPYMQERLGAVLQIEPSAIDPERPLDAFGIDSLMAMDLKLDIENDLGIVVPLTSLLVGPTLAELADEVAQLVGDRVPETVEDPGPAAPGAATAATESTGFEPGFVDHPVSHGQRSLWSLKQLAPSSAAYHMAGAARLPLKIEVNVLRRCLQALTDRHPALRTTFPAAGGTPVQRVHDAETTAVDFGVEDVSDRDDDGLTRRLEADARRPFDLEQAPPFRARLYRWAASDPVLLLAFHHIVGDFWSIAVLMDELGRLYEAIQSGTSANLAPLPLQAADFARRQTARLTGIEGERLWDYWQKQLSGPLPALDFPTDRPRPAVATDRGATRSLVLEPALTDGLAVLSRSQGSSLYTTVLAALEVLLHRYTGQDDVIVGSPVAGRNQPGCAGVVGYFVNTLPMRGDLSGNPAFATFLGQMRKVVHEGLEHQDFPFPLMVDRLALPRDPSRSPLFQVLFVFQKSQGRAAQELTALTLARPGPRLDLGGLSLELVPLDLGAAQFDLTLVAAEQNDRLALSLQYNADLFDAATIERFLAQFRTLLEAIVAEPGRPIGSLAILPPDECRRLLSVGCGGQSERPCVDSISRLFEEQVHRTPDAPAVAFGAHALSYAALNAWANRLAHYLRGLGVGPEVRVGLCVERSIEMVAGIIGILKAGAAYVPLDPDYPEERLEFLIADARIDVLLTQEQLRGRFGGGEAKIVCLDARSNGGTVAYAEESDADPSPVGGGDTLAYVIYTSGSTGKPKGVMVSHRSLMHSTDARRLFYDEPVSGFLLLSSFAFDSSVAGIFGTLCQGGTLVLPPPGIPNDPARLAEQIAVGRVSHLLCVPSLYELLLTEAPVAGLQGLRVAIVAGEPCRARLVARHRAALPHAALVNEYGPTEATVWCTAHRCEPDSGPNASLVESDPRTVVPIGRPIAGARIYVLDAMGELAPIGVAGEVVVGGAGVARGYLGRQGLTAERFVPDPFGDEPGSRVYRTGDLARWRDDGTLEFLGRIDDQVKVRGFRIELGEVEAVLAQHPAVRAVAVNAREEVTGAVRLVAYIVLADAADGADPSHQWRQWLRERLPESMVPAAFVMLDQLPLTPNGKIDRRALPAPDPAELAARAEYVAPRNPAEELLARVAGEVLRRDRVGVNDNLFDLGVDSILSIQIAARARQAGLDFNPALLFQFPSISEISARTAWAASLGGRLALAPGTESDPVPLTPTQRWFFERELPQPNHAIEAVWLEVRPPADGDRLAQVVKHLVARHDALRLRFTSANLGSDQASLAEGEPASFVRFDLSALVEADQTVAVEALAAGLRRSLDLSNGPLLRAALFNLGPDRPQRFLVVVHQLAIDSVSWHILLEELVTLDQALARGELPVPPPWSMSFRQWAQQLERDTGAAERDDDAAYWLAGDRPVVGPLPIDFGVDRDPGTPAEADTLTITLDEDESRALLDAVPHAYNTQLSDALLTALAEALVRWTGHEAVLLDLEGAVREERIDLKQTVGGLSTLCPVILELPSDPGAAAAIKAIKEQVRAIPRQGIGYGLLRYRNPEPSVALQLREWPDPEVRFRCSGELDLARSLPAASGFALAADNAGPIRSGEGRRSHLVEVEGSVAQGLVRIRWTYNANRFRRGTIEKVAEEFLAALRALAAHCLSPAARGYTPSDFPLAGLDQRTLDQLVLMVEDGAEEGLE